MKIDASNSFLTYSFPAMRSLSFIVLIFSAVLSSCGKRTTSRSSYLSDDQTISLAQAFERLDETLRAKAPNIHSTLNSSATIDDLDKLRTCLSGNQVEMLEKWFLWHNGAGEYILPAGLPISVDRTVEDLRIIESIPFVPEVRRNAVKILCDSAGDGFFMDVDTENPMVFHHTLEDPENPVWFGTLPEFLSFIAKGFEMGILFENEEGKLDYDGARYEELMAEYLSQATRG